MQGQNLSLTVLYVPDSLDSGGVSRRGGGGAKSQTLNQVGGCAEQGSGAGRRWVGARYARGKVTSPSICSLIGSRALDILSGHVTSAQLALPAVSLPPSACVLTPCVRACSLAGASAEGVGGACMTPACYRGTWLIRNSGRLGPYSRFMSRALWWS